MGDWMPMSQGSMARYLEEEEEGQVPVQAAGACSLGLLGFFLGGRGDGIVEADPPGQGEAHLLR